MNGAGDCLDILGGTQQLFAARGQAVAAGHAIEQARSQRILQRTDTPADGGMVHP